MSEFLEEKIDRLILGGARTTEKGRLDFPDRLPFCPDRSCYENCVFKKFHTYLERSGRLFEVDNIAIGVCLLVKTKEVEFPDLYSPIDNYSDEYYKTKILPVIFIFYEEGVLDYLYQVISNKIKK